MSIEVRNYAIINMTTGIVENVALWDGIAEWAPPDGCEAIQSDTAWMGWSYADGVFSPPPLPLPPPAIPPTTAEILASQSAKLQGFTQLAAAQKFALTERISQIEDAIVFGDATAAEQVELPKRVTQLAAWKRYSTLLGRVTTQAGWPPEVEWPVQPTEGMGLTVSAMAPAQM